MKAKRQSTVEPVFGSLINHLGMRKVNTGIRQANKQLKMAASAYNLKKYLKFTQKLAQSMKKEARATFAPFTLSIRVILSPYKPSGF